MPKEGKGPAGAGPGQGWLRGHWGAKVVRPQGRHPISLTGPAFHGFKRSSVEKGQVLGSGTFLLSYLCKWPCAVQPLRASKAAKHRCAPPPQIRPSAAPAAAK